MEATTEAHVITKQENLDVVPQEAKAIDKSSNTKDEKIEHPAELLSAPAVSGIDESKILTGK